MSPHIPLAHNYWQSHLRPHDIAIDMTCGNGFDTLALCRLLPDGQVLGIDIQKTAIENTRRRLLDHGIEPASFRLLHQSHADDIPHRSPPNLIVYNLGYLPGGDKSIVTRTEETLQSLRAASRLLAPEGALSITCYPGHPEGREEETQVVAWAEKLPTAEWRVCHHRWINRERAPSLLWIVKQGKRLPTDPRASQ